MNKQFSNQPLVSIIMNCYNGEAYLCESIESVLSQTYKNWDLIFWDNKSEDKSAEIFKSYKDKDLNIIMHLNTRFCMKLEIKQLKNHQVSLLPL